MKIISAQINWKNSFFEKFFFKDLELFSKPLIRASFFSTKNNFILFFKCDYLILIQYLKKCFKNLFRKTVDYATELCEDYATEKFLNMKVTRSFYK